MKTKTFKNQKINIQTAALLTAATFGLTSPALAQNVSISPTGNAPDNSAALDIRDFTNKGVLIPRIALTGPTDAVTIPSPATSLLVYNINTVGGLTPGYYYNAGTPASPNWVRLLNGGSPSNAWLTLGNAGTNPATHFVGTTDNVDLVFRTNNTEKMRITAGGKVGIGTLNPGATLHVHGNDLFLTSPSGGSAVIRSTIENGWGNHDIFVYDNVKFPAFVGLRGRGTKLSPSYPQNSDVLLRIAGRDAIDGYSLSNTYGGCEISFVTSQIWSPSAKGAFITFFTTNNGSNIPTEKMRLTDGGNLCIGFTAPVIPQAKLDANGWIVARSDYGDIVYIGGDNAGNDAQMGISSTIRNDVTFWNASTGVQNNCYATNFMSTSDTTLKENINDLNYGLKEVMMLHPISFNYKKGDNKRKRVGLIAQEVQKIMPELIDQKENLYMHYMDYTAVLTKAIQEQQQIIQEQQKIIQQLQEENAQTKSEVKALAEKMNILINTLSAEKKVGNK